MRQTASREPSIHMNTLVTYFIEFALIWTALMLAWTLTLVTARIIRSAWHAMK
jgi:hypothetical protein